ncbi:MAG: hypothetical protein HMLKMBBP_02126 [Planctomycetes bacterium]|nr:hypothetical protein [Planctomycetota bacterium]
MHDHSGDDDRGPHVADEDLRLLMFDDHYAHQRIRLAVEEFVRRRRLGWVPPQEVEEVVSYAISETFHMIKDGADPREIRLEMRRAVERQVAQLRRRRSRAVPLPPELDWTARGNSIDDLIEREYARRVIEVAESEMTAALLSLSAADRSLIADAYGISPGKDGEPPTASEPGSAADAGGGAPGRPRDEAGRKALQRARGRFSEALEAGILRRVRAGGDRDVLDSVLAFVRGMRLVRAGTVLELLRRQRSGGGASADA